MPSKIDYSLFVCDNVVNWSARSVTDWSTGFRDILLESVNEFVGEKKLLSSCTPNNCNLS